MTCSHSKWPKTYPTIKKPIQANGETSAHKVVIRHTVLMYDILKKIIGIYLSIYPSINTMAVNWRMSTLKVKIEFEVSSLSRKYCSVALLL